MALLNPASLRRPGVLTTIYLLGFKLDERVTAACSLKLLNGGDVSAGCLGPSPASDLHSTACVNQGFLRKKVSSLKLSFL